MTSIINIQDFSFIWSSNYYPRSPFFAQNFNYESCTLQAFYYLLFINISLFIFCQNNIKIEYSIVSLWKTHFLGLRRICLTYLNPLKWIQNYFTFLSGSSSTNDEIQSIENLNLRSCIPKFTLSDFLKHQTL